jgi:SAM-dependent methyltransferase
MSERLRIDPYAVMADFYDQWSAHMTDDVGFYIEEAVKVAGPVLELAAGNGRVAIPIARAGQQVIALDASHAMLTEGARRAAQQGVADRITWIHGDMRTFVADPRVSLAMIPFRSFLHLTTSEDQVAALEAIRRSLIPGGRLILNIFVPDPRHIAANDSVRRLQADFVDERGRRCEVWAISSYGGAEQTLTVRAILEVYESGRPVDLVETELHLRMIYRYEMEHLLARAGFEVEALYGWFDRRPFGPLSEEMIWIARKP